MIRLQILFVCQTFVLTRFFFSAESFYPGRDRDDNNIAPFPADSDHFTDSNDGDTDIEREEDWLAEPQPLEPSTRNSSKISEALAIEVSIHL